MDAGGKGTADCFHGVAVTEVAVGQIKCSRLAHLGKGKRQMYRVPRIGHGDAGLRERDGTSLPVLGALGRTKKPQTGSQIGGCTWEI